MTTTQFTDILNPLAFVSLGTFLGVVISKIFATKDKNNLYIILYAFSAIAFLFVIWAALGSKGNAVDIFWWIVLVSNILIAIVTKYFLRVKNIYKTSELDPVINEFTRKAEKDYINLLCGDINFFGETPNQMDKNSQYTCLKAAGFKEINILCFPPKNNSDRIRYGKLLHDMPVVNLRYYHPTEANLSLRGRITRVQGGDKLLMYSKLSSKTYQAIETDTANSNGALYKNIWELIWDLAKTPNKAELDGFIVLSQQ